MGREVTFSFPPKRIVSLVPSQTEFLIDIGALVVGRTKFCVHPEKRVREIQVIGGTKNFRFDAIQALNPDLIIGNKEENYQEGIEKLSQDFPVWMSDVYSLDDAFNMMKSLGEFCDLKVQSDEIIQDCRSEMNKAKNSKSGKVIYLIWQNPWMAAGKNTFIDHLLSHLGYENLIQEERYPGLAFDEITKLNPDIILLSSEPYPFRQKHIDKCQSMWPEIECQLVDGELYSWYGSRLRKWAKSAET